MDAKYNPLKYVPDPSLQAYFMLERVAMERILWFPSSKLPRVVWVQYTC